MIQKKYNLSLSYLIRFSKIIQNLINRDIEEFKECGFTEEKRLALTEMINILTSIPDDEIMIGIQIASNQNKTKSRQSLEKQIRIIFLLSKVIFEAKSIHFKEFGNPNLSKQSDNDLIRTASIINETILKYNTELEAEGLTNHKIIQFTESIKEFDQAINKQKKAKTDRLIATANRKTAANNLYKAISRYSEIGKNIWRDSDEAKYNDYLIYKN